MSLTILGEYIANVEVWKPQDVSEVLFVLVAIQPSHRSAAVLNHVGEIRRAQQRRQLSQHRRPVGGGQLDALGWHLAFLDAIVYSHPALPRHAVAQVETQRREVETAFGGSAGMAAQTSPIDRRLQPGRRLREGGKQEAPGQEAPGNDKSSHYSKILL